MDKLGPTIVAKPPSEPTSERPWPALAALVTAAFLPATTARKTTHVSLASAYVVHLLGIVASAAIGALLFQWIDHLETPMTLRDVWLECRVDLNDLRREFWRDPLQGTLAALLVVAGVEAGYLLIALLCTAWGAVEEPLRASFRNALHRTWLHTPHILLVVLLCGMLAGCLRRAEREAARRVGDDYSARLQALHASAAPSAYVGQTYVTATDSLWEEAWSPYPFYVRYGGILATHVLLAGGVWWLWALLRFIGTRRPGSPSARPPECEDCGYNLTGIPLDARCPECGAFVALSLGADARPGTPWQQRRTLGYGRSWWRCLIAAVKPGSGLGRQLRARTPSSDHRSFFAFCLVIAFVVAWAGAIACYVGTMIGNPYPHYPLFIWHLGPMTACLTSVLVLTIALGIATVVGLMFGPRAGRNLMIASMQAACYLGGYLIVWVGLAFVWTLVLICSEEVIRELHRELRLDQGLVFFLLWTLPNLLGLAVYVYLVVNITAAARYANR